MGFLRLADLFPEAPAPKRAEPESGVHETPKTKRARAPRKPKDLARVPVLDATPREVRVATEDARARWLVPFIDGKMTLEEVIAASALAEEDARAGIDLLVAAKLVRFV